jgi:hypothetical protein
MDRVIRVWRIMIQAWPIVSSVLLVWAALATIAPQWFQVHQGAAVTNLLLHPATIRILAALIVIWLAVYLRRLESRPDLRRLESRLRALETRPKPGSFAELAASLRDQGVLDEKAQRATPNTSAVATLDQLLARGDDLLSRAKTIGIWNRAVEFNLAQQNIFRWEQEVVEWLKKLKPGFEADFMANFDVPSGADVGATTVLRVAIRLERLRAVKASIT